MKINISRSKCALPRISALIPLLFSANLLPAYAGGLDQASITSPAKGSRERTAVLDAMRSHARSGNGKVLFFVDSIKILNQKALVVFKPSDDSAITRDFATEAGRLLGILTKVKAAWRLDYLYHEPNEGITQESGILFDVKPFADSDLLRLLKSVQDDCKAQNFELSFPATTEIKAGKRYVAHSLSRGRHMARAFSESAINPDSRGVKLGGTMLYLNAPKSY